MKKFAIWLLAMPLLAIPPAADSSAEKLPTGQWEELCAGVGNFAKRIMVERQNGTPMITQMKAVGDGANVWSGLLKTAVRQAYDIPIFTSKKLKAEAAQDFEDRIFSDCLKGNDRK